jgi:hypothetical protein
MPEHKESTTLGQHVLLTAPAAAPALCPKAEAAPPLVSLTCTPAPASLLCSCSTNGMEDSPTYGQALCDRWG